MSFPTTIFDSAKKAKETYASQGEIPLGTRLVIPDGRVFRYAQAGNTALKPFKVVKSAVLGTWSTWSASSLNVTQRATSYVAGATQIKFNYGATVDTVATGSRRANYFRDGYIVVCSTDTAEVQFARLGDHPILSSNSGPVNTFNIPEGLDLELSTETDITPRFIPNPYRAVVIAAETAMGGVAGVPICVVAADYYFWLQTWGPCPVLQGAAGRADAIVAYQGFQAYLDTGSTGGINLPSSGMTGSLDSDSQGNMLIGAIGTYMMGVYANGYVLINLRLAA